MASTLNMACLLTSPRFPLPSWVIYLVLFLVASVHSELRAPAFTLIAPIMAFTIAYRGHTVAAMIGGIVLWYAGTVNLAVGIFVPPDLLAATVWAIFLVLAILSGHVLNRVITQRRQLLHQWEAEAHTRRQELARALHDSVATSLTSVVMRLETASIQRDLPSADKAELHAIAEQARESMTEVRSLLNILSENTRPRSSTPAPQVAELLRELTKRLKVHGFVIATTGYLPHLEMNADQLSSIREVLAEISTNIVKYAEPGSTIDIAVEVHNDHVELHISNVVKQSGYEPSLSTGMGLPAISSLMEGTGGKLTTVSNHTRWKALLRIPL